MFIIRNNETGLYVSKGGHCSYTNKIHKIKVYDTKEEAEKNCCSNETIVSKYSLLPY